MAYKIPMQKGCKCGELYQHRKMTAVAFRREELQQKFSVAIRKFRGGYSGARKAWGRFKPSAFHERFAWFLRSHPDIPVRHPRIRFEGYSHA